ncbi:MAG: hypothetical protein F4Y69_10845 [Chloroflexi bacterium]|nr:hypothetical protein [Chloroflexota bacterium]MYF22339.1 hypothetical protein [Chloroflexota bacterium]
MTGVTSAASNTGGYVFGTCQDGKAAVPGSLARDGECTTTTANVDVKGLNSIQIAAGRNHVYALQANGRLVGWGENESGQIDTPQLLVWRGNHVRSNTADDSTSIGPDDRPQLANANQQPADGNRSMVDQEPVRWSQVATGDNHTCAVTTEGEVHCWGSNSHGQSDIPMRLLVRNGDPQIPYPKFTKIVAGGDFSCVLEAETTVSVTRMRAGGATELPAGSLVCWGDERSFAQLANSANSPALGDPHPAQRQPLPNDASAGDGGVAGTPPNGDLGHADDSGAAEALYQYVDVSAGFDHLCAIRTTGIVDCWGSNEYGKSNPPRQLLISPSGTPGGMFHSIEAGMDHTCAINAEGGALCWGGNARSQEYPPAGEYVQLSSGYWHGCAIWTYDDSPNRQVQPEAPEPAWTTTGLISLSPPSNMDCWGDNGGSANKATPPLTIARRTVDGRTVTFSGPQWYQVAGGATFTCGIFDGNPNSDESPPPSTAQQALRFSATAAVSEGIVHCWGIGTAVSSLPSSDRIGRSAISITECEPDTPAGKGTPAVSAIATPHRGEGRIYGRTSADGTIEFAFKVILNDAPDHVIRPDFSIVPASGSLTVNRWYFSELMTTVGVDADGTKCVDGQVPVGRIAVRLLKSGHMELALMTTNGLVQANIPANHNRIPNPTELNKWWRTDRIEWTRPG